MKTRLVRVLPYAAMLAVSALLYWAAMQIDTRGAEGGRRIGPDFWPKVVIVLMALLSAYEIVKRLVVRTDFTAQGLVGELEHIAPAASSAPAADPPSSSSEAPAEREYPGRLFAGIALVAGFALAVDWLGFFLSTAVFLAAFMLLGGYRRPVLACLLGFAGSLLLIVVFMRVAYISLPLGSGPFRSLSLGLLRLLGVN